MWIVEKNKKFIYYERYIDPLTEKTKTVSVTLNTDSSRAKNEARRILSKRIDDKLNEINVEKRTFMELQTEFMKKYRRTIKKRSFTRHEANLKLVNKKILADALVSKITTRIIQDALDDIYYEDNYSFSTTKQSKSLLRIMFVYAKTNEYVTSNPVDSIRLVAKPVTYEDKEKIETKYLEKSELTALLKCLRSDAFRNKRYADLAEFLSLTGLRIGEALALRYENFNGSSMVVDGTLDMGEKNSLAIKSTTKTIASNRTIDLPKRAIKIIEKIKFENDMSDNDFKDSNHSDTFFCSDKGIPMNLPNINRTFQKAAGICDINKNITTHVFRHTHVSLLTELNVSLKAIMDRVGHSKPETTLKIYTHVTKQMKESVIEKLDSLFS